MKKKQISQTDVLWIGGPSSVLALKYLVVGVLCLIALIVIRLIIFGEKNPPAIVDYILFALVAIPFVRWLWELLVLKCVSYAVTERRLIVTKGVFNRVSDEVELFRVRDFQLQQPFVQRVFRLSNLILITSDRTCPVVSVAAIPDGHELREILRGLVHKAWGDRGVREIDAG